MTGFLGEDQVRKVKEAVDLVQALSAYTTVQKAGRNFKACCPFHQERTPSFYIYADEQRYHCYGCGAHGDVITLVRTKENLEFSDAVELLARRAGLELVYRDAGPGHLQRGERDRLLEVMDRATRFYEHFLWNDPAGAEARAYLASRGLREEVCRRFRLGWAPGRGRLVQAARKQGISAEVLGSLDLAMQRDSGWSDRFFERLMFPICNRFGAPIAFSGRLLPAAERAAKEAGRGVGKYVNSTDTPLYHKSSVVFNLHQARAVCRERGRLVVMEGPTDVMAADQAGYGECVAVLGTALTETHVRQLGAVISGHGQVVLLFDGDAAGQANSLKAVRTCLSCGVPCRVVVLPDEFDPAEMLAEGGDDGKARFDRAVADARSDLDHLLDTVAHNAWNMEQRDLLAAADNLLDCVRNIADQDLRNRYLEQASLYLNLPASQLLARLATRPTPAVRREAAPAATPDEALPELDGAQRDLLAILLRHPGLRSVAFDDLGCEPSQFPRPWRDLLSHLVAHPLATVDDLAGLSEVTAHPGLREEILLLAAPIGGEAGDEATRLREAARVLHLAHASHGSRRLKHALRTQDADSPEAQRLFQENLAQLARRNAYIDGAGPEYSGGS